ncbi:hypothetical protein D3C86_1388870 [compost metagenome]
MARPNTTNTAIDINIIATIPAIEKSDTPSEAASVLTSPSFLGSPAFAYAITFLI